MPITKSVKKRVKTAAKSHLRNISIKSKIKKSIKNYVIDLTENKGEEAGKSFVETVSVLDKAASKGVISKNKASRNKSRLAKKLNALGIAVPKKQKADKEEVQKTKNKKAVAKNKKAVAKKEKPVKEEKVAAKIVTKETKPVEEKKSADVVKKVKPVEKKPAEKKIKIKKITKPVKPEKKEVKEDK